MSGSGALYETSERVEYFSAQVTENLALFGRETYPKLKQQLQRRYPKHEWR